jgi:23S rRNA (cytidine1920-2'-O)/16S rRNA (cytidine1409-2'-O)-methyltransferase
MAKERLDRLLVARGLAETRAQAQRLIMAGQVRVAGERIVKPATRVPDESTLTVEAGPPFVSRGGEKLAAALRAFPVSPAGQTCADVGASTGGFTDCLLQHGAARVYAIDVGKGLLHWKLRRDERVVVMEETNARHLDRLPGPVTLITIDASFISLKLLFPVLRGWFPPAEGEVIALIKPQFEAGKAAVSRGRGVIRSPQIHKEVLLDVLQSARQSGLGPQGLIRSPLLGPKGNTEFLAWLGTTGVAGPDLELLVDRVVDEGEARPN